MWYDSMLARAKRAEIHTHPARLMVLPLVVREGEAGRDTGMRRNNHHGRHRTDGNGDATNV